MEATMADVLIVLGEQTVKVSILEKQNEKMRKALPEHFSFNDLTAVMKPEPAAVDGGSASS